MDKNEKPEIGHNGDSIPEENNEVDNATSQATDDLAAESAIGVEEMLADDEVLPANDPHTTKTDRDIAKGLEKYFGIDSKDKKSGDKINPGLARALKIVESRIRPDPNRVKKNRWLVKGIIPRNATGLLHGKSGARKSFILLDLLIKIAYAESRYDNTYARTGDIKESGVVIYIAAENPSSQEFRIDAFMARYGFSCEEFAKRFWLIPDQPDLTSRDYIDGILALIQTIEDITGVPVKCIVFDTYAKSVRGVDENSNRDVNDILRQLTGINVTLAKMGKSCTFILSHHHGKSKNGDGQTGPRGAQTFTDSPDFSLMAEKLDTPYLATRLSLSKQRDGDTENSIINRFDHINAPPDEDGEIDTTLVVSSVNWEDEDERNQAKQTSIAAREADEKRRAEQSTKRHKFTGRDTRKQNCWLAVQSLVEDNIAITKESATERQINLYGDTEDKRRALTRYTLEDLHVLVEWNYLTEENGTFFIRKFETKVEDIIPGVTEKAELDPEIVRDFKDNLGTVYPNKIVSNQEVEFATDEDLDDENIIEGEVV